jgi:hypothetical protein
LRRLNDSTDVGYAFFSVGMPSGCCVGLPLLGAMLHCVHVQFAGINGSQKFWVSQAAAHHRLPLTWS